METNRHVLEHLFATGQIHLTRSTLFDTPPPPLLATFDFERVEGMLLGLAIGDALGNSSEGLTPAQRHERFGEVRNYLPNPRCGNAARGLPSDDTQLAFWTLEQFLADGHVNPDNIARQFCSHNIYGIGMTVSAFVHNYTTGQKPWYQCGPVSAGNGALMRIAPVIIPHLATSTTDLWVDTALLAMLTHNDAGSTAACLTFIKMLWHLLQLPAAPAPDWWLRTYIETAQMLEGNTQYRPRGGTFAEYHGPIWRFVDEQVAAAYHQDLSVQEACAAWHSGAYLLETVPSVLYILMRHGHNLEEAIIRAVNDTVDNDTVGAIVGAAVGALHGKAHLPERWIASLSGRTTDQDDGRIFDLIRAARRAVWPKIT